MTQAINTKDLNLTWSNAPWDEKVTGYPVWQLNEISLLGPNSHEDMQAFEEARDLDGVGLISCRLSADNLKSSMFLEAHGFRFIEMVYQPELELEANHLGNFPTSTLEVTRATEHDLPELFEIAGSAFSNERFHVDPRLGPDIGNERYQNWVRSSVGHATQELYVLKDQGSIVSFFVTETMDDGTCYWHLNAVSPGHQGQGYGRRSWITMIRHAADNGAKKIKTSIVARNYRVLNLYARLGFRFPLPLMTLHWVRENQA